MQIIEKIHPNGSLAFYDTKAEKFIKGSCIKDKSNAPSFLEGFNKFINKREKTLIKFANRDDEDGVFARSIMAHRGIKVDSDLIFSMPKKRGRGRPPGVKNKATLEKEERGDVADKPKRGRGRPKGSKNKSTIEKISAGLIDPNAPKRGRGRPKGSKNKPKPQDPLEGYEKIVKREKKKVPNLDLNLV
jgi:hypothetical protein